MKTNYNLLVIVLLISTGFVFTRCEKLNEKVVEQVVDPYLIKLANTTAFGDILTDKDGNTLYFFANDANGSNNCTGGCVTAWPGH